MIQLFKHVPILYKQYIAQHSLKQVAIYGTFSPPDKELNGPLRPPPPQPSPSPSKKFT